MKYISPLIIILFLYIGANAQETPLQECSRFLSKSVDEASTCKIANKAKQVVIDKQAIQIGQLKGIIEAYKIAVAAKNETIKILTAIKCSETKTTFFFIWKKRVKRCL